ncbi:hypothetical protein BDV36DRAFT_276713 [Aspergillus pseudocaelatus]|uniref:Zn(2)-C6 fungal-type domain-containing protein n=1 Tax=Aspergillus pseudocaelatus TaxID=1825620 RepID=A0ABQ6W0W3_9EURO|nr:hypothetical protein BDV36DRAFT_276713 [Aspergillus pseudocaelatus]
MSLDRPSDPTRAPSQPTRATTRIWRACEQCRARKVRCDGSTPCSRCRARGCPCEYRPSMQTQVTKDRESRQSQEYPSQAHCPPDKRLSAIRQDPILLKRNREIRLGLGISNVETGSFQFYGPSSNFCFIQRMYQRLQQGESASVFNPATSVADGVRQNIEPFVFSMTAENNHPLPQPDICIPREIGQSFIEAYFEIIHPQMPVLVYSDVLNTWESLWQPPWQERNTNGQDVLYMVLAIGARVSSSQGRQDVTFSEGWANFFAHKVHQANATFDDISLSSTHLSLLQAFFAFQLMRPNEAYLHLGHAARCTMALGIDRSQIVQGANLKAHRLRLTFWTIYAQERACALFSGRPSIFRDEMIDAPSVADLPPDAAAEDWQGKKYLGPMMDCAYVRAMAGLGKIADRVALEIYSPQTILSINNISKAQEAALMCDHTLQTTLDEIPTYLHFFDRSTAIGHGWQEVQRMSLGNHYYFLRMLIYRPALVYATLFDSRASAGDNALGPIPLHEAIRETISCAKSLIKLNHDVYFRRYPKAKFDGSSVALLLSACMTLLYDVLDRATTPTYAKEVFETLEQAIQCLDEIQHIGPMNGKVLSLEVMKIAKSIIYGADGNNLEMGEVLTGSFPWLQSLLHEARNDLATEPLRQSRSSAMAPPDYPGQSAAQPGSWTSENVAPLIFAPEMQFASHWLEAGFDPEEIPNCLY